MEMAQLVGLLPTGSVATVLVVIIIWLMRSNQQDRAQYQKAIAEAEARDEETRRDMARRHAEEMAAAERRHAQQMEYVQGEVKRLRERVEQVLTELEQERRKRFEIEEEAARLRRDLVTGGQHHGRHT